MMLYMLLPTALTAPSDVEFSDQICVEVEGPPKGARQIAASELPWTHEMRSAVDLRKPLIAPLEPLMQWLPVGVAPPEEDVPVSVGLTVAENLDGTGWIVGVEALAAARGGLVPANVTAIIDVSQSMDTVFTRRLPAMQDERGTLGYRAVPRMELAKASLHALIDSFPHGSRLSIVAADGVHARTIMMPNEDIERMHTQVERLRVGLVAGIDPGTIPTLDKIGATTFVPCADNRVFLFTDRVDDVGQREMASNIQSWAEKNVQVWTFAVGSYDAFRSDEVLLEQDTRSASWALNALSDVRTVWSKLFDAGGTTARDVQLTIDFPENATWRSLVGGERGRTGPDERLVKELTSGGHWAEVYEVIPTPPEQAPEPSTEETESTEPTEEIEPLTLADLDPSQLVVKVSSREWSDEVRLTDPEETEDPDDTWEIEPFGEAPFLAARTIGAWWAHGELDAERYSVIPLLAGRGVPTELRAWIAHQVEHAGKQFPEIEFDEPLPWIASRAWLEPGETTTYVVVDLAMKADPTEEGVRSLALRDLEGESLADAPIAWNWRRTGAPTTREHANEVRVVWQTEYVPRWIEVHASNRLLGDALGVRATGRDEALTVRARYAFEHPDAGLDPKQAIDAALAVRPEDGELAHLMVRYRSSRGESEDVVTWSKRCADDFRPEVFVQCRILRGEAFEDLGKAKKALSVYKGGLERYSDSGALNTAIGRVLLALGKTAEAEHHLLVAMTHEPEVAIAGPLLATSMEDRQMHGHAALALVRVLLHRPADQVSRARLEAILDLEWKKARAVRGPLGRVIPREGPRHTQVGFLMRDWNAAVTKGGILKRFSGDLWYTEIVRPILRLGQRRLLKASAQRVVHPPEQIAEGFAEAMEEVEWLLLMEWQRANDDADPGKALLRHRGPPDNDRPPSRRMLP